MVHIIRLTVEVSNLDDGESRILTLPCNLRAELANHDDYIILSTTPDIPISRNDDITKLNDVLDEIDSENPGMTEEYLDILMEASMSGDLFDEEFVRRLKENEFMFCDISDVHLAMSTQEIAAYYLAATLKVPFDHGVTDEMLDTISDDALMDYVDWMEIWEQYKSIGFKLIERTNPMRGNSGKYIVHIK